MERRQVNGKPAVSVVVHHRWRFRHKSFAHRQQGLIIYQVEPQPSHGLTVRQDSPVRRKWSPQSPHLTRGDRCHKHKCRRIRYLRGLLSYYSAHAMAHENGSFSNPPDNGQDILNVIAHLEPEVLVKGDTIGIRVIAV